MRVRVPNLLGPDVHDASFVDFPDELGEEGATKRVLQVRPAGGKQTHMESYSADEVVVVEASDAEKQELADLGWSDVQFEG